MDGVLAIVGKVRDVDEIGEARRLEERGGLYMCGFARKTIRARFLTAWRYSENLARSPLIPGLGINGYVAMLRIVLIIQSSILAKLSISNCQPN